MGPSADVYLVINGKRRALRKSPATQIYMAEYREAHPLPEGFDKLPEAKKNIQGLKDLPHILHALLTSPEERSELTPDVILYGDLPPAAECWEAVRRAFAVDPTLAAKAPASPKPRRKK